MTAVHAGLKRLCLAGRLVGGVSRLLLVVAAVAVASCDHPGAPNTAPAARPLPLFHLALLRRTSDFFYGLTVMRCGDRTPYWTFGDRGAKGAPPDTVTYGMPPRGYETHIGPLALDPGCYRVEITGGASTRFSVERDGRIVALDDSAIVTTTTLAPDSTKHLSDTTKHPSDTTKHPSDTTTHPGTRPRISDLRGHTA